MSKTVRHSLLSLLAGLIVGFGLGYAAAQPTPVKGAYFCCDREGNNCVLSPEGDCDTPLKWCAKTGEEHDGTIYCAQW